MDSRPRTSVRRVCQRKFRGSEQHITVPVHSRFNFRAVRRNQYHVSSSQLLDALADAASWQVQGGHVARLICGVAVLPTAPDHGAVILSGFPLAGWLQKGSILTMLKRGVQWAEPVVSETRFVALGPPSRVAVGDVSSLDLPPISPVAFSIPTIGLCRNAAAGEWSAKEMLRSWCRFLGGGAGPCRGTQ